MGHGGPIIFIAPPIPFRREPSVLHRQPYAKAPPTPQQPAQPNAPPTPQQPAQPNAPAVDFDALFGGGAPVPQDQEAIMVADDTQARITAGQRSLTAT